MRVFPIINLYTSEIARRLTIVFVGNIFAAGLGFIALVIVSRELTVSDFGLFNLARSTMLIASLVAGLGMDTSMIKFGSFYLGVGKTQEATQVLRITLLVMGIISLILAALIFNMSELLSTKVFYYPDLTPLLKLASLGIIGVSILNYQKSALYTHQLFKRSTILQLLVDFIKLTTVIVLIFSLKMNAFAAVAIFAFSPLLGVIFGFRQIPCKLFSERKRIQNLFGQLFSYSKWLFVSNICSISFSYAGIFMLAKMLNSEAVGIYGLALNLTYIFPIVIVSLKSVLLPEVSRFREMEQFENYIKSSLKISLYAGMTVIPFLFFSGKIIVFFFGPRYLDAVPIFNWLLLSYIVLTIVSTIRVALYSMNEPRIMAIIDLLRLSVMVLGCYLLIPFLGIYAPAILTLIVNVGVLAFFSTHVYKLIRSGNMAFQDEEFTDEVPRY